MLNISGVPILTITLRNNVMDVLPIKRWLSNYKCCKVLLDDSKKSVKGFWAFIMSIPVIILVCAYRDTNMIIVITGGFCGAFVMLINPLYIWYRAKKMKVGDEFTSNFNASGFHGLGRAIFVMMFAVCTVASSVYTILQPSSSGSSSSC